MHDELCHAQVMISVEVIYVMCVVKVEVEILKSHKAYQESPLRAWEEHSKYLGSSTAKLHFQIRPFDGVQKVKNASSYSIYLHNLTFNCD